MRTRFYSIAVVVSSFIFILSAPAQAKGKEFRHASSHENESEPALTLESWMIHDWVWHSASAFYLTDATDDNLTLESWMTSDFVWDEYAQDNEEILSLEHWMTTSFYWMKMETVTEDSAHLENWMVSDECWTMRKQGIETDREDPLKLEDWMTEAMNWK